MRLTTIAAAAVAAHGVSAFTDTSPFFLFSTSRQVVSSTNGAQQLTWDRLSDPEAHIAGTDHVATASRVKDHVLSLLRDCPSDTYLIIREPGVVDTDYTKAWHLQERLAGKFDTVKSSHTIRSVVGDLSDTDLPKELAKQCNLKTGSLKIQSVADSLANLPQLITLQFDPMSRESSAKEADMQSHDVLISSIMDTLPTDSYTVIYMTTPPTEQVYSQGGDIEPQQQLYDMDDEQYPATLHPDHFKRNAKAYPRAETGGNVGSNLPLFEKYTFLSSGIFMGGTVTLLLLLILYIGISAISGLEVSYHAFSKDFNPASQKKQQ